MPVRIFDENNWSNMEVQYAQDPDLNTIQQKIFSDSCMNFVYPEFFTNTYDQKNNNYSSMVLTSGLNFDNVFQITNPDTKGNGFVTYISNGIGSIKDTAQRYWSIVPSASSRFLDISTSNFFAGKNPDYYFELDFLPGNVCSISHEYYNIKYYLNLNFLNNQVYMLSANPDIFTPSSLYQQTFEYIYDEANNSIAFFYRKNNNVYTLTRQASSLGFVALSGSNIQLTIDNTFNVLPIRFSLLNTLSSFWFAYTRDLNTNNLSVDCSRSSNTKTQIAFHSEYNNIISPQIPYNFLIEKNQLTQNSQNNTLGIGDKNVREYVSLNTGSNQEKGNLKFSQNFLGKLSEYNFVSGKLNYFHTPIAMGEHDFININDSSLVESGAIYSNTPEFSDKLWKKTSNYKKTSNFGTPRGEINGTWLCAWLSGSSNPNDRPVWYDRYFFPAVTTRQSAFSANDVFSYESHYDCVTNQAQAPSEIFDVKSQLTFEPYTLYAYYRIGKEDITEFLKRNKTITLFDGIGQYLETNGTVLASDNGVSNFSGNQYGVCETINSRNFDNNFSFLFTIGSDNFANPFGHEIIGNLKNQGFGIYSNRSVTPFLRIIDGKSVNIYNSDLILLDTLVFANPLIDVVQIESLDDYFVLDNKGELFQINSQNTIFDSTQYNPLSASISHFSDDVYTFFLVSTGGDVVSYNRKTEELGYNDFVRYYSTTPMVSAQSLKRIGNAVYVMDGTDAQIRENVRIFYKSGTDIKEWNVSTNEIETRFYNSSGSIVTFQIDDEKNFFIFDNNSTCYVHNSSGFVLTTIALTSAANIIASDYSSIYQNGQNKTTIYAICSSSQTSGIINQIDAKTFQIKENTGDIITSLNYSLSGCLRSPISNTDYNHEILDVAYPKHTISVRIILPNIYSSEIFEELNLKINASQLNYGYHEFAVTFDSINGNCSLIVNGQIMDLVNFDPAKYTLSDIITESFVFGATSYFGGSLLFSKLKQENAFTIQNLKIRDVFFFTKNFEYYTIRFLQKYSKNIQPLLFNLPSENRNYTDSIEKFFRQRLPYHKSSAIDVAINNSKITDANAREYIRGQINRVLLNNLPYLSEIKNLVWKENT